jgi:hypothetical protein
MPTSDSLVCCKTKGLVSLKSIAPGDFIFAYGDKNDSPWTEVKAINRVPSSNAKLYNTIAGFSLALKDDDYVLVDDGWEPVADKAANIDQSRQFVYNARPVSDFVLNAEIDFTPNPDVAERAEREVFLPTMMTDDLARLLGFFDSDSTINDEGVALCGPSDDPVKFQFYLSLFEKVFQMHRGTVTKRDDGVFTTTFGSILLRDWFYFINARNSEKDLVSPFILHSGVSVWQSYLTGLFDCDGTLGQAGVSDSKDYIPRVKQAGKNRMLGVAMFMFLLGIGVRLDERAPGSENASVLYDCVVRGRRSRKRFNDLIGKNLKSEKKRERSKHFGEHSDPASDFDSIVSVGKPEGVLLSLDTDTFYFCNSFFVKNV